MAKISKSVGKNAQNNKGDVQAVQALLNNFTTALGLKALVVDGDCGERTITAIQAFQKQIVGLSNPDGRVDPGGKTEIALNGHAPIASEPPAMLSGAAWWHANQAKYENSSAISDLVPEFAQKVQRFVDAMKAGGCRVLVSSTRRNRIRAYLMHYSFRIAAGELQAAAVPPMSGCHIKWDHGNPTVSKNAAREMRDLFNIAYRPSLTSRHIDGKAIDMTIVWDGTVQIVDGGGRKVSVGSPRMGDANTVLHQIGRSYGVIKLLSDKPHWSTDGH